MEQEKKANRARRSFTADFEGMALCTPTMRAAIATTLDVITWLLFSNSEDTYATQLSGALSRE